MSNYLPRELGESGALRVSVLSDRRYYRPKTRQAADEPAPDPEKVAASRRARLLRAINQHRFDEGMKRMQRPARVS